MFGQFHFQEPLWLLAIIPLLLIVWFLSSKVTSSKSWEKVIDAELLPMLLQGKPTNTSNKAKWLLFITWLLATIALADPVWEKIPRPIFQTNSARIIVLDLSNSMLIDDIKPTRMARARFKVEDILAKEEEGQIGLVVFAGDAFTAAPLTRDAETIRALLQVLTPSIMPSQGSRADLGLQKAHELLQQAGVVNGQVLLITDGSSDPEKTNKAAASLKSDNHTLSILAVGTEAGGILKFNKKQQVLVKLDIESLYKTAEKGGGVLHIITNSDADLQAVLEQGNKLDSAKKSLEAQNTETKINDLSSVDWKSTGPFILLILLPLAALAFRKGWLFNISISLLLITTISLPEPLMAIGPTEKISLNNNELNKDLEGTNVKSFFQNFFNNKEQRADKAFQAQQYDKARKLTNDPLRAGSAAYKKGDFAAALESFKSSKSAHARYNEGNTLANLKKYQEAIKAYDEALKQQPDMVDAKTNKKALEDFLKQQQKKSENNNKSDDKKSKNDQQNNQQKSNDDSEKNAEKQSKNSDQNKTDKNKTDKNKEQQKSESDKQKNQKSDSSDKKNQFSEANKNMSKERKGEKGEENNDAEDKKQENGDPEKQADLEKSKAEKAKQETKEELEQKGTKTEAEKLNKEEKMAAEQWLRRIPDDPGGLLRRKFKRQYRQHKRSSTNENPW